MMTLGKVDRSSLFSCFTSPSKNKEKITTMGFCYFLRERQTAASDTITVVGNGVL